MDPMPPTLDEAAALALDAADPLARFREQFHIPRACDVGGSGDGPCVYLVGNSLGLQPRSTRAAIEEDLDAWARLGVEGHFHARHPWYPAHEEVRGVLARVVGAQPQEVVAMNSLTTNLHLLMVSFYRPTRERYKIVVEDSAFPSDSYAVQSQADFHAPHAGFDPRDAVLRLRPREGEATLRTQDICEAIDRGRDSIALVMLGGVNYLTGQLFAINTITAFARARGIAVGWDLAHAAGNAELRLHDDGPDFAAWCSYKYLNSGPGSIAGAFIHERHLGRGAIPRFAGWWGNDPATRFRMGPEFLPVASADAWALSNPPIFALSPLRASLEVLDRATMAALRAKSVALTGLLERLIEGVNAALPPGRRVTILTPRDPSERGCQVSLVMPGDARGTFARLQRAGMVCDFREPSVIRAAPVPLYNSFHDVWRFAAELRGALAAEGA
jgi:kynureninase